MSTSTEFLFNKNSYTGKHKSPPRQFIPKSKSCELTVKPKIDMIECQTYIIHNYLDDIHITIQSTPYKPQIGMFLTNDIQYYIIIDVDQHQVKAVEFNCYLLLSQIKKDDTAHKRRLYSSSTNHEHTLLLTHQDIIKLFYKPQVCTFVVDQQGYKNITFDLTNNHFVISNKFKN